MGPEDPIQEIPHRGRIARAEIRARATPAQAWQAWAEPDRLSEWFTDRATGRARAGGTMTWIFERFGSRFPYEVVVASEPRQLVLKGAPVGRPPYLLEVLIHGEGAETRVRVINSGFSSGAEDTEEYEGVVSGWQMTLSILKEYLERHFGRAKRGFFAMQPAPFTYDRILSYFLEEPGLAQWLTRSGAIGQPGGGYELVLRDGSRMTGDVLAVTSREVALSWEQLDGVVELKAFRLGPRIRAVCVRGCGWDISAERAHEVEMMMTAAVDRLVTALTAAAS